MINQGSIRRVDINVYLPILIEIINSGKEANLLISGNSMSPFFVHERDTIIISKPSEPFKRGDMVFYQRVTGQYVMHRIHHIDKNGDLFIVGDAQNLIEGPIHPDQVFGIIKKAIRKGKVIDQHDFWWWFFEKVWIRIVPLRHYLTRIVSFVLKIINPVRKMIFK